MRVPVVAVLLVAALLTGTNPALATKMTQGAHSRQVAPRAVVTAVGAQSLEGGKGGQARLTTPAWPVTQRDGRKLPGSPGGYLKLAGRGDPDPAAAPARPDLGMIALVGLLALVGAGVMVAVRGWLRHRWGPSGRGARYP